MDFRIDGRESVAQPGERLHVPAGTAHDWWNAGVVPIPGDPPFDPLLFLRLPLVFIAILFWGLGLARLLDGHRRLGRAKKNIEDGMQG